tara:strand:+ start:27656 stop:28933 length:1278 start_codon:yes stop_codon:yes gene_type:complete
MKKIFSFISSLKFAIALLIIIALTSSIGTFIPQNKPFSFYIEEFNNGNPIWNIINPKSIIFLQLNKVYSSYWFILLLGLLTLSLILCSFRRQLPSLKLANNWIDYKNASNFRRLAISDSISLNKPKDKINELDNILKNKNWVVLNNHNRLSARKGLIGRVGPLIVHIGLITLIASATYGNLNNFTVEEFINIGSSIDLRDNSNNNIIQITLKNFQIERDSSGLPKQYNSELELYNKSSNTKEIKTTSVNNPIRYGGATIYQADWGISSLRLKINSKIYEFSLKDIPELGEQVWGARLELGNSKDQNFFLVIDNEKGPLSIFDSEGILLKKIYLNEPQVNIKDINFQLNKINTSSGIILKRDPSIPLIYFSFGIAIIGTILSLVPTQQIWALALENENQFLIGGNSNKNLSGLKNDFIEIINGLNN